MDLGTHILQSLLIEMDISNVGTIGGAIDITTSTDSMKSNVHTPTVNRSERVISNNKKDESHSKLTKRHYRPMREYTEESMNVIIEDWKHSVAKTAGGAAIGAGVAGGGFYLMKKKLYGNEFRKLQKEKSQCQDDDCRDWVDDKIARLKDKMKKLKKQSLKVAAGGAVLGATAANYKSIHKVIDWATSKSNKKPKKILFVPPPPSSP